MRAVLQRAYGDPARVLSTGDAAVPAPGPGQVLVRVHATSVHADVWHVIVGRPAVLRLMGAGFRRPKQPIPGIDFSGVVEAVGDGVARLAVGDEVYGETVRGMQWQNGGTFAEYAVADEVAVAKKPSNLSHIEAAGIPTPGLIAHTNLGGVEDITSGDRVAVNGAGGAVGMFLVQLARAAGAQVTAIDIADTHDMLRQIGADEVIDHRIEDFTKRTYDRIIDIPGNRSFDDLRGALADGGRYVYIGHDDYGRRGGRVLGTSIPRFLRLAASPVGPRGTLQPIVRETHAHLDEFTALAEGGRLHVPIGATFGLEGAADAVALLASGAARGRIILTP